MTKSTIAAMAIAVSILFGGVAHATGEEEPPRPPKEPPAGCTPGYWKNHLDSWVTFYPYFGIDSVFDIPAELYAEFVHVSMLDALSLNGGPEVDGAARILMRHAMAALLNMRNPDVNYPLEKDPLRALVNDALASLDREQMLAAKAILESYNELGCPIN